MDEAHRPKPALHEALVQRRAEGSLPGDLQSSWMGPWEASCKPWVLWNAQGPRKCTFFSLYKIESRESFGGTPWSHSVYGRQQSHQYWLQLSLTLRKPSFCRGVNLHLYAEIFARGPPIVSFVLLAVKEENFGHHLHLVDCRDEERGVQCSHSCSVTSQP